MEQRSIRSDKLSTVIRNLYEKNETISSCEILKLFENTCRKFDDNIYNYEKLFQIYDEIKLYNIKLQSIDYIRFELFFVFLFNFTYQ